MDKVYNFPSKTKSGQMKQLIQQEQKLQFYSEEEGDSQNGTPKNQNNKSSTFKKQSQQQTTSLQQGYQTDDSEGGTPKNQSKPGINQKMSKFRNLVNTKQIEGDVEDDPEYSDEDTKKEIPSKPLPQTTQQDYDIEEQAKKAQEKQKQVPPKLGKIKNSHSQQQLGVNSDNEQLKKSKGKAQDQLAQHPFRHLIYGTTINETQYKKYLLLTQRGLIYAKKCLKGPSEKFIKSKQLQLPEANGIFQLILKFSYQVKKAKTLVLDLDETLIHSCQPHENPQIYVTAYGDYGEEAKIGINIRPYLTYFLQKLSNLYTIYIFTASSAPYCNAILEYIDPKKEYIQGALTRNNCMETKNGFFIKDLRIIANKQLKDIVIIDNLAHSFGFQIENGIPILEWYNDSNDLELKNLVEFLSQAVTYDDIRQFLKEKLKLDQLIEYNLDE